MIDLHRNLLAAASAASSAATDLIEEVRDGCPLTFGNAATGETATALADALRLLLEATEADHDPATQMIGALARFLEDRQ